MGHSPNSSLSTTVVAPDVQPGRLPHAKVTGLRWINRKTTILFKHFHLNGHPNRRITLGRAPLCDIVLSADDTQVSRLHCVFDLIDDQIWTIRDRSTNGTLIHRQEDPLAQRLGNSDSMPLSINMEIVIHDQRFFPTILEGNIGVLVTTQTQLRARAFAFYGDASEAAERIGVSTSTIYRATHEQAKNT